MSGSNFFSKKHSISKRNFILLLIFFLLIGGFFSYLIFNRNIESNFASNDGYESKLGELPIEDAKAMVKYYHANLPTANANGDTVYNPKSIYFELGSLTGYLTKLKTMKGATGVRVYFGRYAKETKRVFDGDTYDFKDHTSVIFVATKKNSDGDIEDILADEKGQPTLYQPYNGGVSCPPLPQTYCKQSLSE